MNDLPVTDPCDCGRAGPPHGMGAFGCKGGPAKPRARTEKAPDGLPWPLPRVAIDTREQRPWRFGRRYSGEPDPESLVTTLLDGPWYSEVHTLSEGDYQLLGPDGKPLEGVCAVERKSMPDMRSSASAGRDRFMRETERLAPWTTPVVIVEAPVEALLGARSGLVEVLESARVCFVRMADVYKEWADDGAVEAAAGLLESAQAIADVLGHLPEDAARPGRVSARSLLGTVLSILVDHRVPILFLPSREWGEYAAAWMLRRAWRRWLVDEPGRLAAARVSPVK